MEQPEKLSEIRRIRYTPSQAALVERVAAARAGDLSKYIRTVTVDAARRYLARQERDE
jgi:uncharacterized protein (DUF1778 family)